MTRQRSVARSVRIAIAVAALAAPAVASADLHLGGGRSRSGYSCDGACPVVAGILLGIPETAFLAVDLGLLLKGDWLSPGWAVVQSLWGTAHVVLAILMIPLGALTHDCGMLDWGIAVAAVGVWFAAHAVVSFVKTIRRVRMRPPNPMDLIPTPPRPPLVPILGVAPLAGGGYASLAWSF